jgi:hypothetical protein
MRRGAATFAARAVGHTSTYGLLLLNAVLAGLTGVGVPIALNTAGVSKGLVAGFFVANAAFAVTYNIFLLPRLEMRGYPGWAFRLTAAAVPAGLALIWFGAGIPPVMFAGGALMMFVTTTVPQVMGRVSAAATRESSMQVVTDLRQILVAGYILGLGVYALVAAAAAAPLMFAILVAGLAAALTWSPAFSVGVPPERRQEGFGASVHTALVVSTLAVILIAIMKSVDVLRSIYLPLFAVGQGLRPETISPLFLATAVFELAALPALARLGKGVGASKTLALAAAFGAASFGLITLSANYFALLVSALLYAIFAAAFQSIGLVLLARATGRSTGGGASLYMAVVQVGTVLGAALPLTVPGYTSGIFSLATGLCALCVLVAVSVSLLDRHTSRLTDAARPNT